MKLSEQPLTIYEDAKHSEPLEPITLDEAYETIKNDKLIRFFTQNYRKQVGKSKSEAVKELNECPMINYQGVVQKKESSVKSLKKPSNFILIDILNVEEYTLSSTLEDIKKYLFSDKYLNPVMVYDHMDGESLRVLILLPDLVDREKYHSCISNYLDDKYGFECSADYGKLEKFHITHDANCRYNPESMGVKLNLIEKYSSYESAEDRALKIEMEELNLEENSEDEKDFMEIIQDKRNQIKDIAASAGDVNTREMKEADKKLNEIDKDYNREKNTLIELIQSRINHLKELALERGYNIPDKDNLTDILDDDSVDADSDEIDMRIEVMELKSTLKFYTESISEPSNESRPDESDKIEGKSFEISDKEDKEKVNKSNKKKSKKTKSKNSGIAKPKLTFIPDNPITDELGPGNSIPNNSEDSIPNNSEDSIPNNSEDSIPNNSEDLIDYLRPSQNYTIEDLIKIAHDIDISESKLSKKLIPEYKKKGLIIRSNPSNDPITGKRIAAEYTLA